MSVDLITNPSRRVLEFHSIRPEGSKLVMLRVIKAADSKWSACRGQTLRLLAIPKSARHFNMPGLMILVMED